MRRRQFRRPSFVSIVLNLAILIRWKVPVYHKVLPLYSVLLYNQQEDKNKNLGDMKDQDPWSQRW